MKSFPLITKKMLTFSISPYSDSKYLLSLSKEQEKSYHLAWTPVSLFPSPTKWNISFKLAFKDEYSHLKVLFQLDYSTSQINLFFLLSFIFFSHLKTVLKTMFLQIFLLLNILPFLMLSVSTATFPISPQMLFSFTWGFKKLPIYKLRLLLPPPYFEALRSFLMDMCRSCI